MAGLLGSRVVVKVEHGAELDDARVVGTLIDGLLENIAIPSVQEVAYRMSYEVGSAR